MQTRRFSRRLAGLISMVGGAALLVGGFAVTAGAAHEVGPTSGNGVQPIHVEGSANRTCQSLADEFAPGDTWTEVKFEDNELSSGAEKDGVTLTSVDLDERLVDWTSEEPAVAVFIKSGADGSNLYRYPAGSTGDTGLGSPDQGQGISHVSVCFGPLDEPPETTTTTTEQETTTTTEQETTTTTEQETTTTTTEADEPAPTEVAPQVIEQPEVETEVLPQVIEQETAAAETLPRTGGETGLALVGLGLLMLGIGFVLVGGPSAALAGRHSR